MKTRMIIGIAVAVVGILSSLVFIGANQINQEIEKTIKINQKTRYP